MAGAAGARPTRADLDASATTHLAACEFQEFMQWTADRQLARLPDDGAARTACRSDSISTLPSASIRTAPTPGASRRRCVTGRLGRRAAGRVQSRRAGLGAGAVQSAARSPTDDFAPMRQLMRAAMRHAGAIRLDHVLGLKRVFMIPHGMRPRRRRLCALSVRAIAARRSPRRAYASAASSIGEDLGTVPEGFRDTMAKWGLWTYRVMLFEREGDGALQAAGSLSGRGARHLQHARSAELPRLARGP